MAWNVKMGFTRITRNSTEMHYPKQRNITYVSIKACSHLRPKRAKASRFVAATKIGQDQTTKTITTHQSDRIPVAFVTSVNEPLCLHSLCCHSCPICALTSLKSFSSIHVAITLLKKTCYDVTELKICG